MQEQPIPRIALADEIDVQQNTTDSMANVRTVENTGIDGIDNAENNFADSFGAQNAENEIDSNASSLLQEANTSKNNGSVDVNGVSVDEMTRNVGFEREHENSSYQTDPKKIAENAQLSPDEQTESDRLFEGGRTTSQINTVCDVDQNENDSSTNDVTPTYDIEFVGVKAETIALEDGANLIFFDENHSIDSVPGENAHVCHPPLLVNVDANGMKEEAEEDIEELRDLFSKVQYEVIDEDISIQVGNLPQPQASQLTLKRNDVFSGGLPYQENVSRLVDWLFNLK